MTASTSIIDVAVVGAGPAGSAAAIALRRRGASVVILESRPAAGWRIGETLPPAARPVLDALGVLEGVEADGHLPSFGNCSSWGTEELVSTDFIFGPHETGWQLDRARFDARLARSAEELKATVSYGCRIVELQRAASGWVVGITSDRGVRVIRTRWLVDATGRRGLVARRLGTRRLATDRLVCVYSVATPAEDGWPPDFDTRTLVEAVRDGWWYTALVPGGRRTVVWLTDASLLRGKPWRDATWFRSQVGRTRHIDSLLKLHGYRLTDRPDCTTANSSRSETCCGPGWIAVGDAALAFDPLSSQGLLNALYTGLHGGEAVAEILAGGVTAATRYSETLSAIWASYCGRQRAYYRMEWRWIGSPFWDLLQKRPADLEE